MLSTSFTTLNNHKHSFILVSVTLQLRNQVSKLHVVKEYVFYKSCGLLKIDCTSVITYFFVTKIKK